MPKGQILDDAFEQALELGQSTAKQSVKAVTQTFSPVKLWEHATGKEPQRTEAEKASAEKMLGKKDASTPLDFAKLQGAYDQQDKQKAEALKNRLFQLVKSGSEKAVIDIRRTEEEKKRAQAQEEADKKRRAQAATQQGGEAEGKTKKGQKKKKSEPPPAPTEVKASQGK